MVRSAICDTKFENYLADLGKISKLSIGLIIGQIVQAGKDYIVHLAKTPIGESKEEEIQVLTNVDNSQVAEHALNAIRMTVGSFNILGLFVVSEKNIMNDNAALQKLKTVLMDIKSTLESNGLLHANTDALDNGDKLIMNYVASHKNFICKTISTDPSKAIAANPVDWKFVSKGMEWQEFETSYEVDTVFPLSHVSNHFDTEKNVMGTIETIAENLRDSLLFFNGEPLEKGLTLEKYNKQNKTGGAKVKTTIYSQVPKLATSSSGKLEPHEGVVRYSGLINSRVFGTPRNSIEELETFIKNDIIRSLTTRLQIYYDALLANDDGGNDDESGLDQDVNSTSPPKRVFYPIGNANILFGDYLFQNETEETTVKQSMDILGIKLAAGDVLTKAEVSGQMNTLGQDKSENLGSNSDEVLSAKDTGKLLLILGIVGAAVALVIAIILHFVLK